MVLKTVVSKECEEKFLSAGSQKNVLMFLVSEQLKKLGALEGECTCGTTLLSLAEMTLSYVANIFLNNYCKNIADKVPVAKH
jgi:hypothetical protein